MHNIIKIWSAYETIDDRGNIGACLGRFSCEQYAKEAAKNRGWYGGDGDVKESSAIKVDGKIYGLASPNPIDLDRRNAIADEVLKQQTLAGLTPEQKRVLGLGR